MRAFFNLDKKPDVMSNNTSPKSQVKSPVQSPRGSPQKLKAVLNTQATLKPKIVPQAEFYTKLLQLEESFYCHKMSTELLNQLVQHYSQLVEYFDSKKDPIKSYFLEKMQFTLSRPQVIKAMVRGKEGPNSGNMENLKRSIMLSRKQISFEDTLDSSMANSTFRDIKLPSTNRQRLEENDRSGIQRKKNRERANQVKLQVAYEENQGSKQVNSIVEAYQKDKLELERFKLAQLHQQEDQMIEKLKTRKRNIHTIKHENSSPQFSLQRESMSKEQILKNKSSEKYITIQRESSNDAYFSDSNFYMKN